MTPVDVLIKHARVGNMNVLEDGWLALLEESDLTPEAFVNYIQVLEILTEEASKQEEAETLATTAMEMLQARFEAMDLLPAIRGLMLAFRKSTALREIGCSIYLKAYSGKDGLEGLIEHSGLSGKRPPRRATRTLDVCLSLEEGTCLIGRHEENVAKVSKIDFDSWDITIDTPEGPETLQPMDVADTYAPAPEDDFRILKAFDEDGYKSLMDNNPASAVRRILQTREKKMTEWVLEEYLTPTYIARKDWKTWFSKARTQIRRVPDINIEGRNPYILIYDPEAATPEDKAWREYDKARRADEKLPIIENYLRECKARKADPNAKLLVKMAEQLEAFSNQLKSNRGFGGMQTLLVAARARDAAGEEGPFPLLVELLEVLENPVEEIEKISNLDLRRRAFDALEVARKDDILEIFEQLLLKSPLSLCDHLAARLEKFECQDERFDQIAQAIISDPVTCGSALAWLWSTPDNETVANAMEPRLIFTRMIWMLGEIKRRENLDNEYLKRVRADVRSALSARNYARFREYVDELDKPMAMTLYKQINRLDNLGRASQEDMRLMISNKFPDMHAKKKINPWEDESTLYCTMNGLRAKEAEIDEMLNVKMAENAKAIGNAAEHGDLSENSEYKFALEERDLLRARLAKMNEEHEMSKVLEPGDISDDYANIGSAVTVRNTETQEVKRYIVLGPWEADPDKNILNYKAPLAQAFMGGKVGDTRTMNMPGNNAEYIIEKLENALASEGE